MSAKKPNVKKSTPSKKTPAERQRIPVPKAKQAVKDSIKAAGFYPVGVSDRIEIYDQKGGTLLGFMELVPRQGYQLFVASPLIKTPADLALTVDDLRGLPLAHDTVQLTWARYCRTHSEKDWQSYLGALAAFYTRAFGVGSSSP